MLGAPGLWVPQAVPWGFSTYAHSPEQSWVPKLVLNGRPLRILSSNVNSVCGCRVQGVSQQRSDEVTARQATLEAGALRGCRRRMGQTALQHRLELQDLRGVLLIVLVAGLDDGATPLRVLNQVVPMLIVLETKRKEKQLHPTNTYTLGKQQAQLHL